MKRKKKGFFREFGKQAKTEATIIHLKIREIDRELDVVMGLGIVQKKYRLDKLKQEYQRKLRKLANSP